MRQFGVFLVLMNINITFFLMFLFLYLIMFGCNRCDKKGQVKCVDNVAYICRYIGEELPQNWAKQMDCSVTGSECKVIENNFSYETYDRHEQFYPLGYRFKWTGSEAAVCVPDEECTDVDTIHCGKAAAYSFMCVQNGEEIVPFVWAVNQYEFGSCAELPDDTDVFFALDTDICIDGESKCMSDTLIWHCYDRYWRGASECNETSTNNQLHYYYKCFELEPNSDNYQRAVCAGDIGPCDRGDRKCLEEGKEIILECRDDVWVYSFSTCGSGRSCYNRDDKTTYCQ